MKCCAYINNCARRITRFEIVLFDSKIRTIFAGLFLFIIWFAIYTRLSDIKEKLEKDFDEDSKGCDEINAKKRKKYEFVTKHYINESYLKEKRIVKDWGFVALLINLL